MDYECYEKAKYSLRVNYHPDEDDDHAENVERSVRRLNKIQGNVILFISTNGTQRNR